MIELLVDGRRLYHQSIPICLVEENSLPGGTMTTTLQTERPHFGEPPMAQLEVDFWEASTDPDALVLGVSFSSNHRIWLNTAHVAFPDKEVTVQLAPGVWIKSYPLDGEEPRNNSPERSRERAVR